MLHVMGDFISMDYLLVCISMLCIVLTFGVNKIYQSRIIKNTSGLLLFSFACQLFVVLLLLIINLFSIKLTTFSLLLSIVAAVAYSGFAILSSIAFKYGKMSTFSMFLMIGGMFLPFLYGIIFLNEAITVWKIIGMVLLIGSLIANSLFETKNDSSKTKTKPIFWVICILAFILNGSSSIITKIHATNAQSSDSLDFLFMTSAFTAVFALCGFAISFAIQKSKRIDTFEEHKPISSKMILFFLLLSLLGGSFIVGSTFCNITVAKTMPAVIEYPFLTGGTTILTALFALAFFKEKIIKPCAICLIVMLAGTILFIF